MKFARDESGSATVELVIWLPLLIAIILLVFELTMFLFQSNHAHDVSRNVTRQVAVGFWTEEQAETEILEMISERLNPQVEIRTDDQNLVRFSLSMEPSVSITGIFSVLNLSRIEINYFMRSEIAAFGEEVS